MTIRVRNGGVYDWETPGPNMGKDSPYQYAVPSMKGTLSADHKADSRGRRYIRLHGIGIGVIRKDKRTNGQELRIFKEFTASGREEKTSCKSIKEALTVVGTKL